VIADLGLTDEDLLAPPERLRDHWDERVLPTWRREIPAIGETVRLDRDKPRCGSAWNHP
jgi:hypothetical protein